MRQNHSFIGSKHMSQAMRTIRKNAKNRFDSFSNQADGDNRAQHAPWTAPGSCLEAFGASRGTLWGLQGLSWTRLGRSCAGSWHLLCALGRLLTASGALLVASQLSGMPPRPIWEQFGSLLAMFWKALGAVFANDFEGSLQCFLERTRFGRRTRNAVSSNVGMFVA